MPPSESLRPLMLFDTPPALLREEYQYRTKAVEADIDLATICFRNLA